MVKAVALWAGGLLVALTTASAQTLSLGSSPASPGEKTAIAVFFQSKETNQTLGLQWEIVYPASVLKLEAKDIVAGEAAQAAGKSVQCAGNWKKAPDLYSYRCILVGGRKPLENGCVAVFNAVVESGAKARKYDVKLERVMAVDTALKRTDLKDSETSIEIR